MAISYPLSLPGGAGIESVRFTEMNAVATLRSPWTFATQVQQSQGQVWSAEVSVVPCQRALAEPWLAFLSALMGATGTFLLGDPNAKALRGTGLGTPVVNGAGQSGNTLGTRGWTASSPNVLRAGDYIQIGQRLHKVLLDCTPNSSGVLAIEIWPRLRESPADGTALVLTNTKGLFRLDKSDVDVVEIDRERTYAVAFSCVEAI